MSKYGIGNTPIELAKRTILTKTKLKKGEPLRHYNN